MTCFTTRPAVELVRPSTCPPCRPSIAQHAARASIDGDQAHGRGEDPSGGPGDDVDHAAGHRAGQALDVSTMPAMIAQHAARIILTTLPATLTRRPARRQLATAAGGGPYRQIRRARPGLARERPIFPVGQGGVVDSGGKNADNASSRPHRTAGKGLKNLRKVLRWFPTFRPRAVASVRAFKP